MSPLLNKNNRIESSLLFLRLCGLGMMMISLPLSNMMMSVSSIWLAGVWLVTLIYHLLRGKSLGYFFSRFLRDKSAVMFSSVYLLGVFGLIWTHDFQYAAWDLRMKLPLLVIPPILLTLGEIPNKAWKWLWLCFCSSLVFAVLVDLLVYYHLYNAVAVSLGLQERNWTDVREISIFISHIRFSMMLVLGMVAMRIFFSSELLERLFGYSVIALFTFFLFKIESFTGMLLIIVVIILFILEKLRTIGGIRRLWLIASCILLILTFSGYTIYCGFRYFQVQPDQQPQAMLSAGGERYWSDELSHQRENGYCTWRNIAWDELHRTWERRSAIPFEGTDRNGNPLQSTLVRYMTSKGINKDSVGVTMLSDADIDNIEKGFTTWDWQGKNGFRKRLERVFFEYTLMRDGLSASGHSLMQRLEFTRVAWHIIEQHFWMGVGTGNVNAAYREAYASIPHSLDPQHRLRAHNQYLTYWLTYGFIGLVYFVVALFYTAWFKRRYRSTLFMAFWLITALSFFAEDTMETQAGVTFAVFFMSVFMAWKGASLPRLAQYPGIPGSLGVKAPR